MEKKNSRYNLKRKNDYIDDYPNYRHKRHSEEKTKYKSSRTSHYDVKRDLDTTDKLHDEKVKSSFRRKNEKSPEPIEKVKPNFATSGKLCEDTNMHNGVLVKYSEPNDAAMPTTKWRLYPFKGDEALPQIYIHRQSAYLIGKDRKVADFPVDHPSCSKQHAAFQYRTVVTSTGKRKVLLYIIDLCSTNGTFLNGNKIEPSRYYELKEKDILKFGFSSREYVVLSEEMCKKSVPKEEEDSDDEYDVDLTGVEEKIKEENFSNDYGL